MQTQMLCSTANKYYSSAGHHEQKNKKTSTANRCYFSSGHHKQKIKKTTGQIKFLAVTIKQIKLVLTFYVNGFNVWLSNGIVQVWSVLD